MPEALCAGSASEDDRRMAYLQRFFVIQLKTALFMGRSLIVIRSANRFVAKRLQNAEKTSVRDFSTK